MVPNDVTPEEKFAAPKRRSYAERMLGFEDESDEATEPLGFVDDIPRAERLTEYKEEKKPRARKAQELVCSTLNNETRFTFRTPMRMVWPFG